MPDNPSFTVVSQGYVFNEATGQWMPAVQAAGGGSSGGLTDAQLRASAVPMSLASVPSHPVTGPLTDAQLRATAVPVSGPVTDAQLRASALAVSIAAMPSTPVTGPLTDTQLRATSVPVTVGNFPATQPVSGTFFQATQPVSAAALPLPAGASSETTLAAMSGKLPATVGQKPMTASLPVVIASDQGAILTSKQPTGGTNVMKTGSLTTTTTTVDQVVLTYTVTALKTFYLTYLLMYGRLTVLAATATILGAISLETPSGTKVITLDDVNPTTSELEFNPIVFSEPIPIAAGVVIRVVVTPAAATSMLWRASFGGYEK